ncbi:unnamed protein product, partial [Didymodactylos carnosus]
MVRSGRLEKLRSSDNFRCGEV